MDPVSAARDAPIRTRADDVPPVAPYRRSILVVEDEPLLRDALARALEGQGYEVVTAASAPDARRAFRRMDPDGVVLDVDLGPGPNGFELADALVELDTGVAIVFLTNIPDPRFTGRAPDSLPPGVAYLRKSAVRDLDLLAETLDAAIRGATEAAARHDRDPARPLAGLSRGQIDVLRMLAAGCSNARIAEARGTTLRAAEKSVERICDALGIDASADANARVTAVRVFLDAGGRPLPAPEEPAPA